MSKSIINNRESNGGKYVREQERTRYHALESTVTSPIYRTRLYMDTHSERKFDG